jgi:hypothetical protein
VRSAAAGTVAGQPQSKLRGEGLSLPDADRPSPRATQGLLFLSRCLRVNPRANRASETQDCRTSRGCRFLLTAFLHFPVDAAP